MSTRGKQKGKAGFCKLIGQALIVLERGRVCSSASFICNLVKLQCTKRVRKLVENLKAATSSPLV